MTLAGQNTLQDFITSFNTGISARGTSARLNSNIDYNLQKQIYDAEDSFSGLNHQLQGTTDLTVVDNFLFFTANSTISQQTIDNSNTFGRNNRAQSGNRTDVIYREFIPRVAYHFGRWADFDGSYTAGKTSTNGGNINARGAGTNDRTALNLASGSAIAMMPMSLVYSRSKEDFDSGAGNEQERINFLVSYIFSRQLRANFEVGHEENSSNNGGSSDNTGATWAAGATWTPSRRTSITGQYNKRGFGNTYNFSARHQRRRWVFGFNYTEDFQTRSQELRNLVLVPLTDAFGQPVFDPIANSNILIPENLATIDEQAFRSESLGFSIDYQGRLSQLSLNYFETTRTGQNSGGENTTRGLNFNFNRSLSRRLQFGLRINFRENETGNTLNTEDFLLSPFFTYTVGPHTDFNFSYNYRDGGGPNVNDNFYENSVTAAVTLHY